MDWFEKVQRYYKNNRYNNDDVKVFVIGKKITEAQYKEITGEDYIAESNK